MSKPRPRVYIAGPYTTPDPAVNTAKAMGVWHDLQDRGFSPLCPHLSHFLHMHKALPYEEWLAYDNEWIPCCHALLRMEGESSGADKEVELATRLGIPVFYSVRELVMWANEVYYHDSPD